MMVSRAAFCRNTAFTDSQSLDKLYGEWGCTILVVWGGGGEVYYTRGTSSMHYTKSIVHPMLYTICIVTASLKEILASFVV